MIVDESGVGFELLGVEDAGTFSILHLGFLSAHVDTMTVTVPLDDLDANRLITELLAILEGRNDVVPV